MADYAISNVARRVVYANTGVGPYAFTFEILANTDIAVYRGSTLLTLTTDYSVTINSNGTGSITLVTAGTGNITIVGARAIQRTSDYTTGGDLFASTLNSDLDSQTIYVQQVAETAERGLKAPVVDPTDINMTLPSKASRAGTFLAFDSPSGNPIAGPSIASVGTVTQNITNINTVATNIADVNTVATNIADVDTVAGVSGNVTTVATNIASVNTNATNIVAIQNASTNATNAANSATAAQAAQTAAEAALDSFDDRYLGAKSSAPTLDNDGNALLTGALYFNTTSNQMKVYTGSVWVDSYIPESTYLAKVNTRTALKNLDTTKYSVVYLTETGREGVFRFVTGNYSARITADTTEGIFIPASGVATTSGAWVRDREQKFMHIEWFGATAGGSANNSAALNAAVAIVAIEGGGQIIVGGYYRLVSGVVISANDLELIGAHRSCGFYTDTAGKQLIKFSGQRQAMRNLIVAMPVFTSTATDYVVWLENVVQFQMESCIVQGGYYCMSITGGACADTSFINNSYLYATGTAMVYLADSTNGVNGAHHFYRCIFNQPYGTNVPNGTTNFKGNRANTTSYSLNDIVIVGNYYLQCSVAGTSGGSAPTVNSWYGVNITDGTVTWRLVGHVLYSGIHFDTNVYYCTVRESDFTSPFQYAIRTSNSFTATPPQTIRVEQCTSHGVISIGAYLEAGRQLHIQSFETWSATDNTATTYGVFVGGATDDVKIINCEIYAMDVGVYIAGNRVLTGHSTITGNATGISVAANTNNFRIIGNELSETARWGANTNALVVNSGTSDKYTIIGNRFGTSTFTDSGSGTSKSIGYNDKIDKAVFTTVQAETTISVGNATPSTSGAGITFPATQSASTNANTLDDYEEGTWTGTIKGSTTDPTTAVTATGTYTKVGRQVFARIAFSNVDTTGAAGNLSVSGLPFSSAQAVATGNVMTYSLATFAGANNVSPYVAGTSILLYHMASNGIWSTVTHNAGASRYLELSATYNV